MFSYFQVIDLKYKILADIGLHFWAYFDTFLDFRQNFDVFFAKAIVTEACRIIQKIWLSMKF